MSAYFVLNEDNEPVEVDIFEWSDFVADPDNTRVSKTKVDDYVISTDFVGRGDMWGDRPTEFFETTVYKDGIKYNEFTSDHSTWDEAKLGHLRIVDKVHVRKYQEIEC